ncbi:uncharacterized protein LOC126654518 [Mercurialis annua]|uniref:uncharacterized protein LOC126654518 n=1 Tax=Mercurialis annua TaxID=3986 RepID=UPI00215DEEA8|nr:uncharacterized protein LOC126654518 [Mercurialis annua]XP_050204371.1 uncharacterized protein LOC126654518 [Mercurialis annua]
MARLIRPLRQWPMLLQHQCGSHTTFHLRLSPSSLLLSTKTTPHSVAFATAASSSKSGRSVQIRSRGLISPDAPTPADRDEGESKSSSDSESDNAKSRNQKKREAKRAVSWGMQLASFTAPQIKRIVRMASLEREVYEGLMLVKRLGPDVREGKRRQFSYIGKLLRDVKPELMDALIHSTKDGDWSRVQAVSDLDIEIIEEKVEESEEHECEEEEEDSHECVEIATRWLDGLITKDIQITNEVYAISSIDFDRQELRKLVRRVHEVQDRKNVTEENEQEAEAAILAAKKPLTRFLRALARQIPADA